MVQLRICPACGNSFSERAPACPHCGDPGTATRKTHFKNPENGYMESIPALSGLWVLLFGPFFFAYKGVWTHAAIMLCLYLSFFPGVALLAFLPFLGFFVFIINFIVYPLKVKGILRRNYLRRGWVAV